MGVKKDSNENMGKIKYQKLLTVPFVVAIGAGLSGLCIYYGLLPWKPQCLAVLIVSESVCFVPLGAAIGLAISFCNRKIQTQRGKIVSAGALAGFIYGGLAVFSYLGSLVGIICFGIVFGIAVGKLTGSVGSGSRIALGFVGLVVGLYALMITGGDDMGKFIMMVLYPGIATSIYGAYSLVWFVIIGYIVGVVVIGTFWNEID